MQISDTKRTLFSSISFAEQNAIAIYLSKFQRCVSVKPSVLFYLILTATLCLNKLRVFPTVRRMIDIISYRQCKPTPLPNHFYFAYQ